MLGGRQQSDICGLRARRGSTCRGDDESQFVHDHRFLSQSGSFCGAGCGDFRDLRSVSILRPGNPDWDLSLFKEFRFTERI